MIDKREQIKRNVDNIDVGRKDIGEYLKEQEKEYRKVLKELGIIKSDNEPLTQLELRYVSIYMHEENFIGS